jgi:hypothetical protein
MNHDSHRPSASRRGVRSFRVLALLTSAAVLGGCASFTPDGGFGAVERTTKERIGKDLQWARGDADLDSIAKRVAELLAKPLTVDDAVQVALLNNRGLQAGFQELGITEAEVVQAGRLPNPGFSFGRSSRGDEREIERGLHFNLARLVAMPLIGRMEARRFEQVQARVAMSVLSLAADTRKAYFTALAAEETVRYMRQVKQAADASAELARRMEQVGNFNKLQRAREQSFYANAALQLARAEQAQRSTRERLVRLLGVWGTQTQFACRNGCRTCRHRRWNCPTSSRWRWRSAWTCRVPSRQRTDREQPGSDENHALRQRAGTGPDAQQLERRARPSAAGRSASSCRCSTGAVPASRAPRPSTCRRCTAPPRPRSTRAPRCARPTPATARPTTSHATTATRSCR